MRISRRVRRLCDVAVLTVGLCALCLRSPGATPYVFEVTIRSTESGLAQLFFDAGAGLGVGQEHQAYVRAVVGGKTRVCRFPLPEGTLRQVRLDPINRDAVVYLSGLKIVDPNGDVVRVFDPSLLQPTNHVAALEVVGDALKVTSTPGAYDVFMMLGLEEPLELGLSPPRRAIFFGSRVAALLALSLLLVGVAEWVARALRRRGGPGEVRRLLTRRAGVTIAATAALATVLSCYPVALLGKSFVSPNNGGVYLLYQGLPTLPGYDDSVAEDTLKADVGSLMWDMLPWTTLQARALLDQGSVPLWNRYNSSGQRHLAQGISMLGNPVHTALLPARGAAWAWDLEFLVARFAFALGLGLAVFVAVGHLPAALAVTATAAFLGFFQYRVNHPAILSVCYSPWILLSWLEVTRSTGRRGVAVWAAVLMVANLSVMTSGTAKEAYMLLLCLNGTGLAILLASRQSMGARLKKALAMVWAGALFVLGTAPLWAPFALALGASVHLYPPLARQAPAGLLMGFFDRCLYLREGIYLPSANLFVLLGLLWSLVHLRRLRRDRTYVVAAAGAALAFSVAFAVVHPNLLLKIPFVRNVQHVDNTFSCVLMVHVLFLAGYGFRACWDRLEAEEWASDLALVCVMAGALLAMFLGTVQSPSAGSYLLGPKIKRAIPNLYWVLQGAAFVATPVFLRWSLTRRRVPARLALLVVALAVLHLPNGQHAPSVLDERWVFNPRDRIDLQDESSEALGYLRESAAESAPFRVVGTQVTMLAGFHATWGIEGIGGPDPLMNAHYRELLLAAGVTQEWGWRWNVEPEGVPEVRRIMDLLNVRYVLSPSTVKIPSMQARLDGDLQVFESDTAWPRAFFCSRVSPYSGVDEFLAGVAVADGPFAGMDREDVASRPALGALVGSPTARQVVPAEDYRLLPNTTEFTVEAPTGGVAVLCETYLAGDFQAFVDGEPVECLRVNHAFKGVALTPGRHRVVFSYWPRQLSSMLALGGLGLALLLGTVVWVWRGAPVRAPAEVG